jgi:hypothetical protein
MSGGTLCLWKGKTMTRLLSEIFGTPTRENGDSAHAPYLPPQPPRSLTNRRWADDETVPGLECSYGTFAYSYSGDPADNNHEHAHRAACHNPVEEPDERHHCAECGGDYCSVHAEPANHDCSYVAQPR